MTLLSPICRWTSRLGRLREKAKRLVERHGTEVGAVAKIAAHVLLPSAPLIVSVVEAVCDYTADKGQELTNERMTERDCRLRVRTSSPKSSLRLMAGARRSHSCVLFSMDSSRPI